MSNIDRTHDGAPLYDHTIAANPRNPDTDARESRFRYLVRDALGLSWDTRDGAILAELKRLKVLDARLRVLTGASTPTSLGLAGAQAEGSAGSIREKES